MMRVLVTGGAGFIGSKLCKYLLEKGIDVTIIDNFSPQIHIANEIDGELKENVRLIADDICNKDAVIRALEGCDAVIHLAAETGTGQSMYEIEKYVKTNVHGTAVLCQAILESPGCKKIILGSSRSVYGEGKYICVEHGYKYPKSRKLENLQNGKFENYCDQCDKVMNPVGTDEDSIINPNSIYAVTKFQQEQLISLFASVNEISFSNLRFQNVYGEGQSLKNPYTGILAVFSNLARENKTINIFEDGLESRDFIHVDDVVKTIHKSLYDTKDYRVVNVGTGMAHNVHYIAQTIVRKLSSSSALEISGNYRLGDIRHNFSDNSKLLNIIDVSCFKSFESGIDLFLNWSNNQLYKSSDSFSKSLDELRKHDLLRKSF
jgi:dTDP-L-rhamnose 4-epimerase